MTRVEAVRAFIRRGLERMKEGTQVLLAVTNGGDELLGQTMLFNFDHDNVSAELGFWVSPDARGRGVASTCVRLTCKWGFEDLRLERIFGMTTPQNVGAQRAMESAGLRREGVLRGYERTPGGRWDMAMYGLLFTDDF
jgi:RimJ/RimL family protein N-acetyltransferase